MQKITQLTPEQEGRLIEFREHWRNVGLCCDPADFATGDEIIRGFYARLGKPSPLMLHFSSPMMCELAVAAVFAILDTKPKQLRDQLGDQLRDQLWDQLGGQLGGQLGDQLGGQLWDQLGGQLGGQLGDQLGGQLWGQLRDQLRDQLWDQFRGQLWDQLRGQLWDQLWDQLGGQLWDQLGGQLWGQLRDQLRDQLWDQFRGQLWDQLRGQLWDQLWDQLGGQLWDQLGGQLWGQLRDQLRDQLWDQFRGQLWDQLRGQLWGQLWDQLWDQLRGQLGGQLGGQLRDQLRDQLWDQLGGQLGDQLGGQLGGQLEKLRFLNNVLWGQHDCAWQAFYLFGREIGVMYRAEDIALLQEWGRLSNSVGWWAPWEGICFVSDRPRHVSFDSERRLHGEAGKAVEYSDGWGVSAWHGVRVPDMWLMQRDTLTAVDIFKEQNAEVRRAGCEIIGWDRILRGINARMIDDDGDPQIGTLYEGQIPGASPCTFLKVRCGTGREFTIPTAPGLKTALEAQAWIANTPLKEWSKPEVRG